MLIRVWNMTVGLKYINQCIKKCSNNFKGNVRWSFTECSHALITTRSPPPTYNHHYHRHQPQPKEQLKQAKSTRAYPNLCIVVNLEFWTNFHYLFIFWYLHSLCTFVYSDTVLYVCLCVILLFCFSSGSMILQSSLKFLLLGLKRSHFKFNILKVHFSQKMEDLH